MALDDLQAYGIAPYDTGTIQPYNRNAEIAMQANAYLDRYAPTFPTVPTTGAGPAATAQPSTTGPTEWEQQLAQAIEAKGNAFTPDDFQRLKEGFKINLAPRLFAAKLSQAGVDAELAKFDAKADSYLPQIFGEQALAQTQPGQRGSGIGATIGENVAAFVGGVAQTVPGVMALADYGLRALPGIDGRTPLGDAANAISEGISGAVDRFTTPETLAQREAIARAIEADPSLANVVEEYLGNGRNLSTLVSGGIGSLVAPAGLAKYLGRAGGFLEGASNARRVATVAGAAGLPASGTQGLDLERRIDQTPLEDLIADNPRLQTIVDASRMIGLDDSAIEKRIKDEVKGEALRSALPAYIAGNVGLATIPGLRGAEGQIARQLAGQTGSGFVRRVAAGVGSEAAQEGGAAALQTGGENFGLNRPLGEGAAENIVPSTIVGGLVGGAVSLPGARRSRANKADDKLNDRLKKREDRAAPTPQEGAQGAPSEAATPAADVAPTTGVGPYDGAPAMGVPASTLVGIQGRFDAALAQRANRIKKYSTSINTPDDAIARAQIIAQDLAGDAWPTLNIEQRLDLVERTINAIAKTKAIDGLGDAIVNYKAQVLPPVQTGEVVETGEVDPAAAEIAAAAVNEEVTPPETPAPQTPTTPPQEAPSRDRLKRITRLKNILTNEFGVPAEELSSLTAEDLNTLYTNRKAEETARKKAEKEAADKAAKAPARPSKLKRASTTNTEEALLNNYLAYLADKPLLVDPQYRDVIARDPRLADARAAMAAGTITDTASLKAFLQGEAAASTEGVTTEDTRLVGAILGDKKLKKASDAKVEVRQHLEALKGLVTEQEARRMTLAQLRTARKALTEVTKPAPTKGKALPKSKKPKPKQETPAKAAEPAKRAKTSPKTQAPAKPKAEVGAQQKPAKKKAARKSKRAPKLTAAEQVRQRFTSLDNGTVEDLITAVELAQQGEEATLSEAIREGEQDEVLTKDDSKFLRKLAAQEYKPPRQVLKEEINELIEETPDEDVYLDPRVPEVVEGHPELANPNFVRWTHGHPIVELGFGDTYEGGPAVFEVVHGSTYSGIDKFDPNIGNMQGYLGRGIYTTTNPDDAAHNYAGIGPDLQVRIDERAYDIAEEIREDDVAAREVIDRYLEANNLPHGRKTASGVLSLTDEQLEAEYLDDAINWLARQEIKGDNEGTSYKLFVRLDRPFNVVEATSPVLSFDQETQEGDLATVIESIENVAEDFNLHESLRRRILEAIYDSGELDEITHRDVERAIRSHATEVYDDNGELMGPGQFLQEVLRDTGLFDGIVMDANERFGRRRIGGGGITVAGMAGVEAGTLHVMPFTSIQVKSAVANQGTYSEDNDSILHLPTTSTQVARNTALHMEIEEATDTVLPDRVAAANDALASLEAMLVSSDEVLKALDIQQQPARGAVEIAKRLAQLRANPGLRKAADFAIWLLEGNPQVANVLSLTTSKLDNSGSYNPANLLVTINESNAAPRTIVHEILHHTERMMPTELQAKIRGEYAGRLVNKLKQANTNNDAAAIAYLTDVIAAHRTPSQDTRKKALDHILSGAVDADEYYKYLNPSEYWAESASEILSRRYKNPDDWKAKLKEWFREFIARLKDVLNLDTDSAVYAGLREVLEGTGEAQSTTQIRRGGDARELLDARRPEEPGENPEENPDEDDPYLKTEGEAEAEAEEIKKQAKAVRIDTDAGTFQHVWETLANNVHAFEEVLVGLNKAGGKVDIDNNPADNYRIYNGRVSRNNKIDRAQVVAPAVEWVDNNWAQFAHDKQSFIEALNRFFGNTNFLERIRTDWMLKVPLNNGMEVRRIDIIEGLQDGSIEPADARRQLTTLVQANASVDMREHALAQGMSEKTFDAIQTKLDELFQAGIDQDSMAELNSLLDGTRARIRQRLVEAGYFPSTDPYQEFYGWKWYVPLKGVASEASDIVSQNAFDMIPDDKLSLAKLNKQIEAMEGRKTFGQRPFERLFVDLARAGERSAHTEFMQSVYDLVIDNQKALGAKIRVFTGTPRTGYTNSEILDNEGNPKVHGSLPKPTRGAGFIFNDGDTHYVVDLPRNSQLLRGLILSNATLRPPAWARRWIGTPTNLLARGYTTLSPFWQTATGFVRDLTTLPTTIAVEAFDNPLQATRFFTRYGSEILQLYKAAPTFLQTLAGDVNALETMADENPDSYAAWLRRWEEGGGSNEYTKAFDLEGVNRIFTEGFKDAEGIVDATKAFGRAAIEYTGNYANFLEQMSRVAAFKALVEGEGMSDKEAAIRVRKVLDYQQTGLWGRNINSALAFFRVGMTSVDTMRRIFRKPTGGLDAAKMAKWMLPFAGFGGMAYFMISAMLGDDEDGKKRMHKMRPETLTQKMLMPFGDGVLGVNIGLGLPQLMLAPGVLMAAVTDGHITMEEAAGELYATILRNGPFRLAGYKDATPTNVVTATALGLTPTVLAPMFSLERNTDAFDRPIHTEFDNKNLPHSEQGRSSTPRFFTDVARTLYDWTGVDYYPEDIKYLIVNYGGQNVADLIKMTADISAKNAVGLDAYYNPVTSRFEVRDEDYYDQDRMYQVLDEAGESKRRVETIKRRALNDGLSESAANALANRFLANNPDEAAVIQAAQQLARVRTKRSQVLRELSRDRVTSVGRKQIIRKEQDRKMREATDRIEQLLEQIE